MFVHRTWIAGAAMLAGACWGSSPRPVPPAPAPAQSGLPALYAPLFVEGKSWEFAAELVSTYYDGGGPVTDKQRGTVTCTINEARDIRGGRRAELACDSAELSLPSPPSGTIVGTASGLYRVGDDFEDDAAKLGDKELLLGVRPSAERVETKDEDGVNGSARIVAPHAGGWCVTISDWAGDAAGWTLCLRESRGLIGGSSFFSGGRSIDVYFGEVPRD